MIIVFVQHGEAKREEEDPERPLTERGKEDTRKVGKFLSHFFSAVRIFHSGKTRAEQTARILQEYIGGSVERVEGLAPNDPPDKALEIVNLAYEKGDNVVIVGHLPHLAKVIQRLCGSDCVKFTYSGAVAVTKEEKNEGKWKVIWYINPTCFPPSQVGSKNI